MKICVYGAGAVGGHLAARLADGGADVSLVARGAQLAAIRENGLRVHTKDRELIARPTATDRPADLGPQDVVFVTVKAPALPAVAGALAPLVYDDTAVVFVTNGIPWWYFREHGGDLDGTRLDRLDPGGVLWDSLGPDQVVGAVAYTACTVLEPGVIKAGNPRNRLLLGRPDGGPDARLDALAELLAPTGLEATVTPAIRDAVWSKLLMNMVGGGLGVLTASPMRDVLDKPGVAGLAKAMATEGAAIARALGCDPGDPDEGLSRQHTSGHLQSIAQDLLAGRPMEIDAMLRVPLELAALRQVPTPELGLVVELATQRARAAGLYDDTGR